jgi:transposase
MKILYRRCAALDVHKKSLCACVRQSVQGDVQVAKQTFGTCTDELERLGEWLRGHKVRRVAMESTGVYWMPVWNVLEQSRYDLDLLLVNPVIVKALPGHKTDPKDAARIAELHQYGLLRGSFMPPKEIRRLRDLVRARTHCQQDKNRVINRRAGLLERANVKLGAASNIVGMSGRRILYAMLEGEHNPARLASLAVGSLQNKEAELIRALRGRFNDHFRFQLGLLLEDLRYYEKRIDRLESRIRDELAAHTDLIRRLCTIPGVDEITAWVILSEIGLDMSVFPTADHLASWAGLCPGKDESAGKRRSGRVRKGNRYLRRTLVQNAWAVSHSEGCFLTSLFFRVASRRGLKRAALAVAHRILIIAYHILRDGGEYRELGGNYHDRLHPLRTAKRLVRRLDH